MTYNYLATLRLHDNPHGRGLTVGPKRRVVFSAGIDRQTSKQAVKAALRPLAGYWSVPDYDDFERKPEMMSYRMFRNEAKRLLVDAGLLTLNRKEFYEESAV